MRRSIWLVYSGLTSQQQPGSYRGGDYADEMSVSLVEETGTPRGDHRQVTGMCLIAVFIDVIMKRL